MDHPKILNAVFSLVRQQIQDAEITWDTKACILNQKIPEFYKTWARPQNMQSDVRTKDSVWHTIEPILRNDDLSLDFKTKEIVENVDKLYGVSGWEVAISDDSGYCIPTSFPHRKHPDPSRKAHSFLQHYNINTQENLPPFQCPISSARRRLQQGTSCQEPSALYPKVNPLHLEVQAPKRYVVGSQSVNLVRLQPT